MPRTQEKMSSLLKYEGPARRPCPAHTVCIQGSFIDYRAKWSKTFETQCILWKNQCRYQNYQPMFGLYKNPIFRSKYLLVLSKKSKCHNFQCLPICNLYIHQPCFIDHIKGSQFHQKLGIQQTQHQQFMQYVMAVKKVLSLAILCNELQCCININLGLQCLLYSTLINRTT